MTQLTLARPEDLERLDALVAACQAEAAMPRDDAMRRAALAPLLDGTPHGAAYLIGPRRAPIGHVVVGFGWSLDHGGLTGSIDSLYIRPGVRGRGIGTEVLRTLPRALAGAGLKALHLAAETRDGQARRLFARAGFRALDGVQPMTRQL